MKDDYKLNGKTSKVQVEIEQPVLDKIQAMADYTQISLSELTNTALKRFASGHKDFLPPGYKKVV